MINKESLSEAVGVVDGPMGRRTLSLTTSEALLQTTGGSDVTCCGLGETATIGILAVMAFALIDTPTTAELSSEDELGGTLFAVFGSTG